MLKRIIACLALTAPLLAHAYCSAPYAPVTPSPPQRPSLPFCFGMKNCSQSEIDSYKRDMERWGEELKRYVEKSQEAASAYMKAVVEFAKCEMYRRD